MKIRVYHIPQVPGKPFYVFVDTLDEAVKLCTILAHYDLFQYENNIKGDYCNTNGIELINEAGEPEEHVDPEDVDDLEYARELLNR